MFRFIARAILRAATTNDFAFVEEISNVFSFDGYEPVGIFECFDEDRSRALSDGGTPVGNRFGRFVLTCLVAEFLDGYHDGFFRFG